MKKIIAIAILICAASAIHAQNEKQKESGFSLKIGGKAGINMSKISGVAFSDQFNLSYHAGAFMEIDFTKAIGIQPELLWSQTKTTTASGLSSISAGQDVKLDYLTIPVLLRINVDPLLTLHVGPQFGIKINESNTVLQNGQEAFKNGDFSMIGGAQLNLKYLRIYGRYIIGLSSINDISSQDNWKSQQIQLGIGLRL